MGRLQIYQRRERLIVSAGDHALRVLGALAWPFRRRRAPQRPQRILLFRLERIGDLLMVLPAIADVRAAVPGAEIDLVVGSWNRTLAEAIPGVSRVHTLDPHWLVREGAGQDLVSLIRAAAAFRASRYDMAINFEPDVRSNLLLVCSGAAWTVGYSSGGGGPLLDVALEYDPRSHTTDNARRLVATVFNRPPSSTAPSLAIPTPAKERAGDLIGHRDGPLIGVHVSGGREIKQWPVERFAEIASRLARDGATIVLTGAPTDRAMVDRVKASVPAERVVDLAGDIDLLTLGAVLGKLDLLVTGDTGPMHLAAAVGTPIVAIFGPSDPARYAPRGAKDRIVRIDLPCAPCNRIRVPPQRCTGHTPECLAGVGVEHVMTDISRLLRERRAAGDATPAR